MNIWGSYGSLSEIVRFYKIRYFSEMLQSICIICSVSCGVQNGPSDFLYCYYFWKYKLFLEENHFCGVILISGLLLNMNMNFNPQSKRPFWSEVLFESEFFYLNVIAPILSSEYRVKNCISWQKWNSRNGRLNFCIRTGIFVLKLAYLSVDGYWYNLA